MSDVTISSQLGPTGLSSPLEYGCPDSAEILYDHFDDLKPIYLILLKSYPKGIALLNYPK